MERWLPVVGYEGKYEVSDMGRVRSVSRYVHKLTRNKKESRRWLKGQILRPGRTNTGHLSVALGKGNSRQVHQLVLEAFVGKRPVVTGTLVDVLHLNGVPYDNRLENLRYGTRSENLKQDYATGVRKLTRDAWKRLYLSRKCRKFLEVQV